MKSSTSVLKEVGSLTVPVYTPKNALTHLVDRYPGVLSKIVYHLVGDERATLYGEQA